MHKIFFLLFTFFVLAQAAEQKKSMWTHQYRYTLKKDQNAHVVVSTSASKGEDVRDFYFRWTLMVGDRVTTLVNYKGYPKQFVLYKKSGLNRARFELLSDGPSMLSDKSYLLLVLSDIDQSKNEVDFDIFIYDEKKRTLVEFKPTDLNKGN